MPKTRHRSQIVLHDPQIVERRRRVLVLDMTLSTLAESVRDRRYMLPHSSQVASNMPLDDPADHARVSSSPPRYKRVEYATSPLAALLLMPH